MFNRGAAFNLRNTVYGKVPLSAVSPSVVYIISAPASPLLGFLVDRTGRNVLWVLCAVVCTLLAHMMLAFTFWNPWIAMLTPTTPLLPD